jgi:ankyrin repeat protein
MEDPFLLIRNGDVERFKELMHQGGINVNQTRWSGFSLIHRAAEVGCGEICKVLVEAGVSINTRTAKGWYTPLHIACGNGYFDTAMILIELGADPWKKNKYKDDPYDFGAKRGFKAESEAFRAKVMKRDAKRSVVRLLSQSTDK